MLVTFSGMDGAGKSTQIQFLSSQIKASGLKPVILWGRGGYTPLFKAFKKIIQKILGQSVVSASYSSRRKNALGRPYVARFWLSIAIIDLILFWGVLIPLIILMGRVVICDRYIDDTRLDFMHNFPNISFQNMWLWLLLERVVPTPDAAFLLLIPVDEAIRRSLEKNDPFPNDERILSRRYKAYTDKSFFPSESYIRLNCCQSVKKVNGLIIDCLEKKGLL